MFGAGKSASVLIDFLMEKAAGGKISLVIADANQKAAAEKIGDRPGGIAVSVDIKNDASRNELIQTADLVISLMPPVLHILIAKDCLQYGKHLLTASYADAEMNALDEEAKAKGLLFLCEMGLDPGIDHMSALQMIGEIKALGGHIHSFKSHCGGLVAPESDNNPWHYKISWNPRNIVTAGKQGAIYRFNGETVHEQYEQLFDPQRTVMIGRNEMSGLAFYPNRNSLPYIELYGLQDCRTFIRTTLRHPDFIFGWKNIIDLQLTDEADILKPEGSSLRSFFSQYLMSHGFENWLENKLTGRFRETRDMLEQLLKLMQTESDANQSGRSFPDNFMIVDREGNLKNMELDEIKSETAAAMATKMHEANLAMKQLFFLGLDDDKTMISLEKGTAADILQFALEKKLVLHPEDKDLIVMLHELEYSIAGKNKYARSLLWVKGENSIRTAMAKTVGLPLGIAAMMILDNKINLTGVQIPVHPLIYNPVLNELKKHGISFEETVQDL